MAASLSAGQMVVILLESSPGGQHLTADAHTGGRWCWYDRPDHVPGPPVGELVAGAQLCVVAGEVHAIDHYAKANRLGYIWLQRGYRYMGTGRRVSTGKVRADAMPPAGLLTLLAANVGTDEARSVNDLTAKWIHPAYVDGRASDEP